jgi:hypothetical protein
MVAAAGLVRAEPLTLDLEWRAPAGCPDRNGMRRLVEEMLGGSEPATSALVARGGVAHSATDRWVADLATRGSSGNESVRSFEGPTCESVSRAAALVIALSLHPNEQPPPPRNPERDTRPPEHPIAGRFARPEVAAGGAIDVGATPGQGVAYGGAIAAGWSFFGPFRGEASAAYFAPRHETLGGFADLGANVSLAAFGVRGCYAVGDAVVSWAPCIGGGVDWLHAAGFGSRKPDDADAWVATLEAGGIILWNFNEFAAARLGIHAVMPLTRPEFTIEVASGPATVYRRTPVGLRAALGVELHF